MADHRHPTSLLQPSPLMKWKLEVITMDFIIILPEIIRQRDSIMVLMDKLTKETHFIHIKFNP